MTYNSMIMCDKLQSAWRKKSVTASIMEFTWNGWGIPGYLCAQPIFKARTLQIRGKDAEHSVVAFSMSLCCDTIESCLFKTAGAISPVFVHYHFYSILNYAWKRQKPSVKFMCVRPATRTINLRWRFCSKFLFLKCCKFYYLF
jgi:hypothetical protein